MDGCFDCGRGFGDSAIFVFCPDVNGYRCRDCFKLFVEGGYHG